MNRKLLAAGILTVALSGMGSAQGAASPAQSDAQYTKAQLKQLVRDAHTSQQYGVLAAYYGSQQKDYLKQAAEEKQEWIRRSQNIMVVAAKYPRPVDSARYLYEYFTTKATEAGQQAARYGQLAAPEPLSSTK
ncbi:MAG: hypothetical protein ABSE99_06170 [Terracidiphilus sp.]|jgi:1,4-alpha-glucan branching enzyme